MGIDAKLGALILLLLAGTLAAAQPGSDGTGWAPGGDLRQVAIWPGDAPDLPPGPRAPESVFDVRKLPGKHYVGIANVSEPTLTFMPPQHGNSGAAIVVFPGGGFNILAIDIEGTEICDWVVAHGMTCALLKYRVPASNHHWDKACRCHVTPPVATSLQDAQRAIRLVRAQAGRRGIDAAKVGVIGFSAGGYLAVQASNQQEPTYRPFDDVDAQPARPDFAIALYPGHLCRPGKVLDPGIRVGPWTPPTFLLQAMDDPVDEPCNSTVYAQALATAGVPAEVHLFARGGHAFGLRPTGMRIAAWPGLVEGWLREIGVLQAGMNHGG